MGDGAHAERVSMSIRQQFNPVRPYAILMKGRADEPASHQEIAVYSKQELDAYRQKGWKTAQAFLDMVNRAQRKDR